MVKNDLRIPSSCVQYLLIVEIPIVLIYDFDSSSDDKVHFSRV